MNLTLISLLLISALPQSPEADGNFPQLEPAMDAWQVNHGEEWQVRWDRNTGYAEILFGFNAAAPFEPTDDNDWFGLTRVWAAEASPLLGVLPSELVNLEVNFLPLGMANGTDKMAVQLGQEIGGVPVERAFVNGLFSPQGRLLSLANTTLPGLSGLSAAPSIDADAAEARALRFFRAETRLSATSVSEPELLFARLEEDGRAYGQLAWRVQVLSKRDGFDPQGAIYMVAAADGAFLRRDAAIHHFDVTGRIDCLATGGSGSNDTVANETPLPVPFLRVTSPAGTVDTDVDGNFTIPGVNSPVNLTVSFLGDYSDVNNSQGLNYSVTFNNVQPNQANVLLMNPNPSEFLTAQANAFIHNGVVRDFITSTFPGDTHADFTVVSNTNLPNVCNAYWDGSSTNFYAAGGGCSNTSFSNVVAHELGHWLNSIYNTGNGGDGMGEGNADVIAMYASDTPIVGEGFFAGAGELRNGLNTRQYCGDGNGGCYGQVHNDGEVWMGAAWKVRAALQGNLGNVLGGQTVDQLFLGWLNAYDQTEIDSIIEIQWLTLDDDDGVIANGTPNHAEIDSGFRAQGFPGYDIPYVVISGVTQLPDVPDNVGPYTVQATIVVSVTPPLTNAFLHYSWSGSGSFQVPMTLVGPDLYEADIPNFQGAAFVEYFITGTDSGGQSGTFPDGGAANPLTFSVGTRVVAVFHDFESGANGWGVGAPNHATTGTWEVGDPIGTVAQPEDDHSPVGSNCWFTGQGTIGGTPSENDVDGGTTSLISPVFDLSAGIAPEISFWLWYSNQTGASPQTDSLLIDLSADGGASWTLAERVGPTGDQAIGGWIEHRYLVNSLMAPTSNMRLRVRAGDFGGSSIVEAALDDFVISYLEDSGSCPAPSTYCVVSPNSFSTGAVMQGAGSQNVSDNSFNLSVSEAVPGQFGLFYYGNATAAVPTGAGVRCVGGTLFRLLPPVSIDALGGAQVALDFPNLPMGGGIQNGETWYFSFWFRDPGFGGSTFNFANGLEVQFCP